MTQRWVVMGNGMAGMRALEELSPAMAEKYDITVFGVKPHEQA